MDIPKDPAKEGMDMIILRWKGENWTTEAKAWNIQETPKKEVWMESF
jgi:hypothetical protein